MKKLIMMGWGREWEGSFSLLIQHHNLNDPHKEKLSANTPLIPESGRSL